MRQIYTFLFYLLVPLVLLRLYWRGFKAPEYRQRWTERLAIYPEKNYCSRVIWIHAVSVGEVEAVFPLVRCLQERYPKDNFLMTTTTPTGSARVKAVLNDTVEHVYLPYDLPYVIRRFIKIFKPKIAIIMEKEIWPNLYFQCEQDNIPIMIINARLSASSAKGYKKIPGLVRPALTSVAWIGTQTTEDKQRFIEIGAIDKAISVTGNLKFDLEFDDHLILQAKAMKQQLFADRFVWIVASTHENEEDNFLDLYPQLKKQIPELLLILVPRHPERFERVKQLVVKRQLNVCMRASGQKCTADTDIYIADTMGELKLLYGVADICFVGGSMVPVGGHNILEPAVMQVPILFGPFMINFKQIAQNVLDMEAAIQCSDKQVIFDAVISLYQDQNFRKKIVITAKQFVMSNQGATKTTANLIDEYMS